MKYSIVEFMDALKEKYNDPFEILEYNGISKEGKFKCGYCNESYHLAKMSHLLDVNRKHICSHCFASSYAEYVLNFLKEAKEFNFVKFGYNGKLHKPTVIYECNLCHEINEKPLVEFKLHPTCIHCGDNAKRRSVKTINDLLPDGFILIGDYINQYEKTLIRHSCGFIFKTRPKDVINGHTYCPKCSKKRSKGERAIASYLNKNNINYEVEKTFEWSNRRRYDFYLKEYNLLIEYNGIQHYQDVPTFPIKIEEQKKIDEEKYSAAISHNFNYLVISYLDFNNIENILAQRLKEIT